jgi:hypothetical protein
MTTTDSHASRTGRTVRLVEQRWVERPQEESFEYAADFSHIEDWDPGVASSRKIGDGSVGVGTQYALDVKFGNTVIPMIYEITDYEPASRVVLVGRGEKIAAVDEIRFTTADNMTVIDYTADLTFYNFIKYLLPFMGGSLKKVGVKALDGLVMALDG